MPTKKKVKAIREQDQAVESMPRTTASAMDGDPPSRSVAASAGERPPELIQAMRALEIDPWEVLSYRIYPDRVVVIQGPAGWKRVWERSEGK